MSSEMVERVSRALCRRHECGGFGGEIRGDIARYIEATVSRDWPKWSEEARTAIEVMREPTKAMVLTGDNHTNCGGSCGNRAGWHAWVSMIDVALKE